MKCLTGPVKFVAVIFMAVLPLSLMAQMQFEGFEDDFIAGRCAPDAAYEPLCSGFSCINLKRPQTSCWLTLRDRDICSPGGVGGGFQPNGNVALDFSDGCGSYLTFRMANSGSPIPAGHTFGFEVMGAGSDGGTLTKYTSADGVSWTQVGDNSCIMGPHTFVLEPAPDYTYFRLQVGSSSIFDGVHLDNFETSLYFAGSGGSTYCFGSTGSSVFEPDGFLLGDAYPNPFNPTTTIDFTLPLPQNATLSLYSLTGEKMAVLWDGPAEIRNSVQFDGNLLPSGVYIYKLETRGDCSTKKMMLMK